MSVTHLNRWINDLKPRADWLAAMDKLIVPHPLTPTEVEQYKEHRQTQRNPCAFRHVTEKEKADARPENCPPDCWEQLLEKVYRNVDGVYHNMSSMWTLAGFFKDGPKVYCPTLTEWQALARVELRVPLHLYRQPFHTVAIIIPDGAFSAELSTKVGRPAFAVLRHWNAEPVSGFGGILDGLIVGDMSSEKARTELNFRIVWPDDGAELIESRLQSLREATMEFEGFDEHCGRLDACEIDAMDVIKRACLNACLLLSQQTPRLIGKANPDYAAKLVARSKKKVPAHIAAANARELRLMPTIYGFHQHIRVVERVTEDNANPSGSCPPKRPHWRRGFWRNQAVGTTRTDHRLVFIPATLVNEHLLSGPRSATRVTMTTD